METEKVKLTVKVPSYANNMISYRGFIRDALREDGQEGKADLFFIDSFIHYKEFGDFMASCVEVAKKYDVETVWE